LSLLANQVLKEGLVDDVHLEEHLVLPLQLCIVIRLLRLFLPLHLMFIFAGLRIALHVVFATWLLLSFGYLFLESLKLRIVLLSGLLVEGVVVVVLGKLAVLQRGTISVAIPQKFKTRRNSLIGYDR